MSVPIPNLNLTGGTASSRLGNIGGPVVNFGTFTALPNLPTISSLPDLPPIPSLPPLPTLPDIDDDYVTGFEVQGASMLLPALAVLVTVAVVKFAG